MRKLIAAINMTLDGYCDHTAVNPDEKIHEHYTELLGNAGVMLYGRTTYELMTYWQNLVKNPSGEKSMDDFAVVMDKTPKLVFSHTLKNLDWESARLANKSFEEEVLELKNQSGKDIFIGSPSLIVTSMNLNLLDELQLCVHPVIVGSGKVLFKDIKNRVELKLLNTKVFDSGAEVLYYQPIRIQ